MAAAAGINAGLSTHNTTQVFNEVQNLLNAGANISKLFWGSEAVKRIRADRFAIASARRREKAVPGGR